MPLIVGRETQSHKASAQYAARWLRNDRVVLVVFASKRSGWSEDSSHNWRVCCSSVLHVP